MKNLPVIVAVLAIFLMASCSGTECYENHSALPLANFFSSQTRQKISIQRLEIYGIGAPGDSVLYTPATLSDAYLPFRLWEDTTSYVFAYHSLSDGQDEDNSAVPSDTITFCYTPKEWFVSPACGAMYFYEMKEVRHTNLLIDSVSFNPLITNENIANIQIFFNNRVN